MDADCWHRVESILDKALMSDPASWPALLESECSDDPELRAEVQALLAQFPAAGDFLTSPPRVAASALVAEAKQRGERLTARREHPPDSRA